MKSLVLLLPVCATSLALYVFGRSELGYERPALSRLLASTLESVGLVALFFIGNTLVGVLGVVAVRTLTPLFLSVYHFSEQTLIPLSLRMFQIALTFLSPEVTGTRSPSRPVVARKSMIPCRAGSTPVAMLVQITGESIGVMECRRPRAPARTSLPRLGKRPALMRGSMMFQSAPSRPMRRTFVPVPCPGRELPAMVAERMRTLPTSHERSSSPAARKRSARDWPRADLRSSERAPEMPL